MPKAHATRHIHQKVTGLSGNEIFCLRGVGLRPGPLCVGNSVFSLGLARSITSGLKALAGGEIKDLTELIHEGRHNALLRMKKEASEGGSKAITGVSTELIVHGSNIEFLTIGSAVHRMDGDDGAVAFTSSADAQELFCQIDAGFTPKEYVFGNIAYSIGVGGGIGGALRSLSRGEVAQFTEVFDRTRHLALERMTDEAKRAGANAVVGIETTITSLMGAQEMVMIGTASTHPLLEQYRDNPITSDMTNEEMWNMIHIGYMPLRLVLGVSVYSLGLSGGITSALRSFVRGEITELTSLLYEARELSLDRIQRDAERWGADEVVGVKTHIYELGGGLLEFLAVGTAVKKIPGAGTKSATLPPQAIIQDKDTYFESARGSMLLNTGRAESASKVQMGPIKWILGVIFIIFYIVFSVLTHGH